MTISLVKLTNGEEVLGSIVSDDEYGLRLNDPLLISIERDYKTGLSGLTLLTYIPFSDEQTVLFNKTNVISVSEIDIYMTEYYEKSLKYNRSHHDKKYKQNINYAISQLDSLLSEPPPKKKKQVSDVLSNVVYTSFQNSSNTYN